MLFAIFEAANHLSEEFKEGYPNIPWNVIRGFRNVLGHEYFRLDLDIIYQTAIKRIPELAKMLTM